MTLYTIALYNSRHVVYDVWVNAVNLYANVLNIVRCAHFCFLLQISDWGAIASAEDNYSHWQRYARIPRTAGGTSYEVVHSVWVSAMYYCFLVGCMYISCFINSINTITFN